MSEEEDSQPAEPLFFSSSKPAVATTVTVSAPKMAAPQPELEAEELIEVEEQPEVDPHAMRDFATDFRVDPRAEAGIEARPFTTRQPELEATEAPEPSLFNEPKEEEHRDLDVPAFLRRLRF